MGMVSLRYLQLSAKKWDQSGLGLEARRLRVHTLALALGD